MRTLPLTIAALTLAACGSPPPTCGSGTEPVIVTGLNGLFEGEPAVEIVRRVPDTCEGLERRWMFYRASDMSVRVEPEPTDGVLSRAGVDVEPRELYFREVGVGVRNVYPMEDEADEVAFEWFAELDAFAVIDCSGEGGSLACSVRP